MANNSGVTMASDTIQMRKIINLAREVVLLKLRGRQMAYQRSIEMTVNVNTDTATDTAWNIEND